jgi:hypothetical protein
MHVCRFIELFGAPSNYDCGAGERMHKQMAKYPGRHSQKRHETFTHQAAIRLADRNVVDYAYEMIINHPSNKQLSPPNQTDRCSRFRLDIDCSNSEYEVAIVGFGTLSKEDLSASLYPNLIEFIISYAAEKGDVPNQIMCSSEAKDADGVLYRAHHNYRQSGFWHDWAYVSYANSSTDGFSNVPCKVLGFLPNGFGNSNECLVVCHPCEWRSQRLSTLVRSRCLVRPDARFHNAIPYDIVPLSALTGHCLVVPDLADEGKCFEVLAYGSWPDLF